MTVGEIEILSKEANEEQSLQLLMRKSQNDTQTQQEETLKVNRHRLGIDQVADFYEKYKTLDKAI